MRKIKEQAGKRRDRIRLSAMIPIIERGKDPRRSLGRQEVTYVQGGEVCKTGSKLDYMLKLI